VQLVFEYLMHGREGGTETHGSAGKQDVLHTGIDRTEIRRREP
jgi:hypothetical protein